MPEYTIKLRRATAAQWTSANPVLALAEPGYETDTDKMKLGDGSTAWNSLPYFVDGTSGGAPTGAAGGDLSGTYPNPGIAAGAIVNADVNAAAAIATSKISGLDAAIASIASGDAATLASAEAYADGVAGSGFPSGWFSVKDPTYGATGDGTTNDTAAINAAIAAAAAVKGTVYFPPGVYRCTSALTALVQSSGVTLKGAGNGGTFSTALGAASIIKYDPASSTQAALLTVSGCHGVQFEDLTFEIGSTNVAGHLMLLNGGTWDGVFNSFVRCTFGAGTVGGAVPSGFVARGANCLSLLSVGNQNRLRIRECSFVGGQRAIDTVGQKIASGITGVSATGIFTTPISHGLAVGRYVRFMSKTGGSGITIGQAYAVASVPSATTFTCTGLATLGSDVTDAAFNECGQTNATKIEDCDFNWQTYAPINIDWVAQSLKIDVCTFESLVGGAAAAIECADNAASRQGINVTGCWFGDAATLSTAADWIKLINVYGGNIEGNFFGPGSTNTSGSGISIKACQGLSINGNRMQSGYCAVRWLSNCWGIALTGNDINGMTNKTIDAITGSNFAVTYSFAANHGLANAAA